MITPELTNYIKERQTQGASREEIKQALIGVGWQESDIEEGFKNIQSPTTIVSNQPTETTSQSQSKPATVAYNIAANPTVEEPTKIEPISRLEEQQPLTSLNQPLSTEQLDLGQPVLDNRSDILEDLSGKLDTAPTTPLSSKNIPTDYERPIVNQSQKVLRYSLLVVGGLVLLLGGRLLWNVFFQSPQKIVQKMTVNLISVKSLEYNGQIKTGTTSPADVEQKASVSLASFHESPSQSINLGQGLNFSLDFQGKVDNSKEDSKRSNLIISFDAGNLGIIAIEWRSIDKINYLKLEINRILESFGLGGFDLSLLKKYWMKIDLNQLLDRLGSPELSAKLKQQPQTSVNSAAIVKPIKEAFGRHQIILVKEKLKDEKINDRKHYHYKFSTDAKALADLIGELQSIEELSSLSAMQLDQIVAQLKILETMTGELWIDKKTLLPYRVIANNASSKSNVITDLNVKFNNFNVDQKIEVPEPSRSLETMVYLLYQQAAEKKDNLNLSSTTFNDTDQDGLFDVLEPWFGTKKDTADTDGDGYSDGIEIENDYNPLGKGRL